MVNIKFDNSGNEYEIPDEVSDRIDEYYRGMVSNYEAALLYKGELKALRDELEALRDAVRNMAIKNETMNAKKTKAFRIAYNEAKNSLYRAVPNLRITQKELFR